MSLAKVLKYYDLALQASPVRTKVITSVVLTIIGDLLAQLLQNVNEKDASKKKTDLIRTFHQGLWGVETGIAAHLWYSGIELVVPGDSTLAVVGKIFLDQTIYTSFQSFNFFIAMSMLQGKNSSNAIQSAKQKIWPAMKAGWTIWPAVHFITYKFIPIAYRVPWVKFVVIFWTAYLSSAANSDNAKKKITK